MPATNSLVHSPLCHAQRTADTLLDMKVADVLRLLHDDGWQLVATKGSHRQFKHPTKRGRVTVSGKPVDDLAPGMLTAP
jgi:predicted RNA binding protein YcfA (HicA-like mRNA interferase family)